MNHNRSFQRLAGWTAVIAFVLMYVTLVLQFMAINFDFSVYDDPSGLLSLGEKGIGMIRLSMVTDMWGWYLLPIVALLFLGRWFKPINPPLVQLFTLAGVINFSFATMGAVIFMVTVPALAGQYVAATEAGRVVAQTVYDNLTNIVDGAFFGGLPLAMIWFLGMGWFLRQERRGLGIFMLFLGVVRLYGYFLIMFEWTDPTMLEFLIVFFISPLFWLWLGIDLLRKPIEMKEA